MKKIAALILMAGGLFWTHPALPQTNHLAPGGHSMSAEERFNRLSQELNLTDEQKPKVQAILEQMRQQVQASLLQAKTNADAQLQNVLNPEQYQQLQNLWQQSQRHWENRQGDGR